jgi:hypothetical protein
MRTNNTDDNEWRFNHRPTRWYEWLLILLLLGLAGGVRAGPVYKCTDAAGDVAYQQLPCSEQQQTRLVEIDPAPAWQPSPQYAVASRSDGSDPRRAHAAAGSRRATEPMSYECHAADGQVFYRHSGCPHSIAATTLATGSSARRGNRSSSSSSISVSSQRVTRDEACAQMHRAGAISRAGHEHDEDVSTYDRNLGRDPCR